MTPICLYHKNCQDGFGAAWVVWTYYQSEVELFALDHSQDLPDLTGRHAIFVDICPPVQALLTAVRQALSVKVLDHHATAPDTIAAVDGLLGQDSGPGGNRSFERVITMDKSGCGLAWEEFYPFKPLPKLLEYIQDRDLWRFAHGDTSRAVSAAVFSYPYDLLVWNRLVDRGQQFFELRKLIDEGAAIERRHLQTVRDLLSIVTRSMKIGGHIVPVANLPVTHASEAGHQLCADQPFAACYMDAVNGDGKPERRFSLRSRDGGVDVSEIAKHYGGGGHKHAAGFSMPLGWEGE